MWRKVLKILAIIFSIFILLSISGFVLVFHGPLIDVKELYVTTAMTTLHHQYLARLFVSEEEIQRIMEKNRIASDIPNSNIKDIRVFAETSVSEATYLNADAEINEYKIERMLVEQKRREEHKKIELKQIKGKGYEGYILIVHDPARVRIASTNRLGEIGVKLKDMVVQYDAVGGINAGGFVDPEGEGFGGVPTECIIENQKVVFGDKNKEYDMIGLTKEHIFVLGRYTLKQALDLGIRDAVAFSPFLVVNGEPVIKEGNGGWGLGPRTAIGQTKDGKVLMLVIDGRQLHSIGATLKDVQDILLEYGAYNAANLDGGSSTVMYYEGKLINKPCSPYGERFLPSAFIIGK